MRNSLVASDIESLEMETAAERICASKDAFFRRLAVADASVQKTILQVVQQELQQLITDNSRLLVDYYPTIARLAREAPYDSIRETMALLQSEAKKVTPTDDLDCAKDNTTVSYFVDTDRVERIAGNDDSELCALFQDEYLRTGRVSHFVQLLAWHKSYLQLYQQSVVSIMIHDGALPQDWRSYIALMAASELRCHYFADLQQYYFVVNGGEYEWTMGIDSIPPKLFSLHELSSLLAHRPWLIKPDHIAELLSSEQEDSWSVAELVHAIVVLCQYHSMSCVALGLGCAEEEDLSIWSHEGAEDAEAHAIRYLQRLESEDSTGSTEIGTDVDIAEMDRDESQLLGLLKMSEHRVIRAMSGEEEPDAEEEETDPITVDEYEFEIAESEPGQDIHADCNSRRRDTLWRFCGGSVLRYADFDVHSDEYSILNTDDFSWAEHGFSLVRRYFPGKTGLILEDQFNLTSKLTYKFCGDEKEEEVDTSPYRNAIWYYVHRIFGICHDDYDYRQVNVYLNRPTKIFIKKVACTPWKVTKDDFEHFDHTLSPSEKCHVTLLVAEARKQAGLMYGLRAVMQHMK